ncbi:MAG: acetylglutamate kinase, partial [Candidatus Latescibacteria bacterium]|nr:acetylglutamate kinase [Candidatus Latescibacterota bacterium]
LIYITDVPGISIGGELRERISLDEVESLIDSGAVSGGMIPKLMNAAASVINGVGRVHIVGWTGADSIVDSLDPSKRRGTVIE